MSQAQPIRISGVVIANNEEANLARCLKSLQGVADEVVVVDSFSTDRTVGIAKELGARVFQRKFDGYAAQKNWANDQAQYDYILSLDADEELDEGLRTAILQQKESREAAAYEFNRKNYFCGTWIRWAGWYPDWKLRLWDRRQGRWEGEPVHEKVVLAPDIRPHRLSGALLHFSFRTPYDHFRTIVKYSGLRVTRRWEQQRPISLAFALSKGIYKFLSLYFLKLGFLNGKAGWQVSMNASTRYLIEYGLYQTRRAKAWSGSRICFFNTTPTWGGGEKWHVETAKFLQTQGPEVAAVVAPKASWRNDLENHGIPTFGLRCRGLSFLNPWKLNRLRRYFKEHQIQAVIFNGSHDLKAGGLAAFLAGVPHRIYRRGLDRPPKKSWINQFFFSVVVTQFLVNSRSTASQLTRVTGLPADRLPVTVLYNGVNLEPFASLPSQKLNPSPPWILGTAARLVPQKGLDHLVEVAGVLAREGLDFELRIAGTGPEEARLRERVSALGLEDRVSFEGFVKDIPTFLGGLDLYLCSSEFEGFGYSVVEAMLSRKPVVAFAVSSLPELVSEGKTGLLVPPFDRLAFVQAVQHLCEDDALRHNMGIQARIEATDRFDRHQQHVALKTWLLRDVLGNSISS